MYDILNKLNTAAPEQATETKTVVKESVQARGSIVAGVKSVEQKLREQFEAMKEGEKVAVKGGTVHKGTYGNEYDPGDDGTKKPKHVPKKGVKGRPKKEKPAEITAPKGDIFGRTTGKVPKGKKGTEIKGKAMSHADNNKRDDEELDEVSMNPYAIGMAQAKKEIGLGKAKATGLPKKTIKKAHHIADVIKSQTNESRRVVLTMLAEGVNFNEMMAERGRGIDELLAELQADIKNFKESGSVSDFLRDCMEVHGYGKKQLQDATRVPQGPSFAPEHPGIPAPKPSFLDKAKAFGQKALDTLGHPDDETLKDRLRKDVMGEQAELNELAKLAGLQVEESLEECMSPIAGGAVEMQQAEQQKGRMSVNTSADSEGHKTVTITADGDEAEKLAQILALAGIGSHHAEAQPEQAAIVVAQEGKEENREYSNSPHEEVKGMDTAETAGIAADTDDLHKQKDQHPDQAAKGDNPLTKKEKTVEDADPLAGLGAQLMAEYQSIKLQK